MSRLFQAGEGPSRGLLCDCETSNFAKVCFQLYLEQLGHHADAEALGVAAVDAALGGGGHLAVLAARLAALQPLLVDPLDRAPEEGAA